MEFENLMQDREFCEKLENAENDDVIIQLFAEKGFSVTKEQIEEARAAAQQEELDEESLDGVSGGILLGAASWAPCSKLTFRPQLFTNRLAKKKRMRRYRSPPRPVEAGSLLAKA